MAQVPLTFTVTANTCETRLLVAEFADRIKAVGGIEEAERRIGRKIDGDLIRELMTVEPDGKFSFRVLPTPEFDRCLAALW